MLELYRDERFAGQAGAAVVRGGSVHATADALIATRRAEVPLYSPDGPQRAPDNGFRLVAAVPLPSTGAQRLADVAKPLPPPGGRPALYGYLQVNVDVPAEVRIDGNPAGQASPGLPVNLSGLAVGAHQVAVSADGYTVVSERHQIQANRWTQVAVVMTPVSATSSWPTITNSHLVALGVVLTTGLIWLAYRRQTAVPTGLADSKPDKPTLLKPEHPFEPKMIALPGGRFWMGSPEDEPER